MTKIEITKQDIQDYVQQYNFGQRLALNINNISKELSKMQNSLFENLSQIFDNCDLNKSGSLDNINEMSIFLQRTNKLTVELPSIFIERGETPQNGSIVTPAPSFAIIDENKNTNYETKDLVKFLFPENNSNEEVSSVGLFSYNAGHDNAESLKIFDSCYNDNFFKYGETKQNLLKKLREMISNNEISFENGLSNDEVDKLFCLKENILNSIVNKEVATDKMKFFFDTDMEIVEHLQEGNFSDFKYLDKGFVNSEDMLIIWNTFKEKNGISIYNDLISKYENKTITEEQFINNMKILLNSYNTDEMKHPGKWENTPYAKLVIKLRSNEFDLSEMKKFNMDKYIDTIFKKNIRRRNLTPGNEIYEYLAHKDFFDIKESSLKKFLPEISDNFINPNTKIQIFNGKQFIIEYEENTIHIRSENNKDYTINLEETLKYIEDKEDKEFFISIIKNLPAPVLIDLSNSNSNISVVYDSSTSVSGNANLRINLAIGRDVKEIEKLLIHELGHIVHFKGGYTLNISEVNKILKNTQHDVYKERASHDFYEAFAEIYTMLNLGHSTSDYTIATYLSDQVEPFKQFIYNRINEF